MKARLIPVYFKCLMTGHKGGAIDMIAKLFGLETEKF